MNVAGDHSSRVTPTKKYQPNARRPYVWPEGTTGVEGASKMLGVCDRTIRRMIGRGQLNPSKYAGRYQITITEIQALFAPTETRPKARSA